MVKDWPCSRPVLGCFHPSSCFKRCHYIMCLIVTDIITLPMLELNSGHDPLFLRRATGAKTRRQNDLHRMAGCWVPHGGRGSRFLASAAEDSKTQIRGTVHLPPECSLALYNYVIDSVVGKRASGCTGSEPHMTVTFPSWEPPRASQTGSAQLSMSSLFLNCCVLSPPQRSTTD